MATQLAALQASVAEMTERAKAADAEAKAAKDKVAARQRHQQALCRFAMIVPVQADQLPTVELPPESDRLRLYFLELFHFIQWQLIENFIPKEGVNLMCTASRID